MQPSGILQSHVLDIIFENRNKSYGAYILRKYYSTRMVKALIFTSAISILFLFICQLPASEMISNVHYYIEPPTKAPPPIYQEKMVQPPAAKNPADPKPHAGNTAARGREVVIVNSIASAILNQVPTAVAGPVAPDATGFPVPSPPQQGPAPTAPVAPAAAVAQGPVFTATVMPAFPGGIKALRKFLEKNLVTPSDLSVNETAKVVVRFVVGFDGRLKSFQVIQDGGKSYNEEVLRVIRKMPDWIPGESNGEKVDVYMTIPVVFQATEF